MEPIFPDTRPPHVFKFWGDGVRLNGAKIEPDDNLFDPKFGYDDNGQAVNQVADLKDQVADLEAQLAALPEPGPIQQWTGHTGTELILGVLVVVLGLAHLRRKS